jgi:superfamily II DNA/RNA helicase
MLNLPIPRLRDGKFLTIVSEPSEYIIEGMKQFADRAEQIRDGNVDPSVDNMLKITNEARLLGTDPRLLDPEAPNYPGSKVNLCVENVLYEYTQSLEIKGTQIVFCDVGTPNKNGKWSVYDYMKEQLMKYGIPDTEICFIHDANTEKKRESLFEDLRNGTKRIIIGSTPKMGTGTNIQDRLVALHHLECPWRPSDLEQRDGRGLRQGNKNEEVAIYRYVTKNTFDAYSWQLVEQKQKFIAQVMTNKSISRTCEDIDETVLSYAEVKALATGNPLIKEKMDIDTEVARLRMLKTGFLNEKYKYEEGYQRVYPQKIEFYKKEIQEVSKDLELRSQHQMSEGEFIIEILSKNYQERREAGEALNTLMQMEAKPTVLGKYKEFMLLPDGLKEFSLLVRGVEKSYRVELGFSAVGNISRIENLVNGLEDTLEHLKECLRMAKENLKEAKINAGNRFQYEAELEVKERRQVELNQLLELDKQVEVLADEEIDMVQGSKGVAEANIKLQTPYVELEREAYELEP